MSFNIEIKYSKGHPPVLYISWGMPPKGTPLPPLDRRLTEEECLKLLMQAFIAMEGLADEINEKLTFVRRGVSERNAELIIGGLAKMDKVAEYLKNLYEVMVFINKER